MLWRGFSLNVNSGKDMPIQPLIGLSGAQMRHRCLDFPNEKCASAPVTQAELLSHLLLVLSALPVALI